MEFTKQKHKKDEEILALSLETPSAFEALVDRYQRAFLRAAFKIVNHREESEDIVQEAFVKIYSNAGRFKKQEGASFKSWAYKIVINTAFSHYKKLKRTRKSVEYADSDFYNGIANTEGGDIETEMDMKILVSKILPKMPNHLKEVLRMYYIEDRSQKDIAREENVSVTTIKMRLFRAKKTFKKILDCEESACLIM